MHRSKIPNLFIVGQPKSGSTALHNLLHEHPQVFMAPYKEPHYFCRDFHAESDTFHKSQVFFPIRNRDVYLKLFTPANGETVVGESSVNYLYSESSAMEIAEFNPAARIIIILRNPIHFIYSLYQMSVAHAWETAANFEEAISLEGRRAVGASIPQTVHFPSTLLYGNRVRYYDQVKRFLDRFPAAQVKVLIYEDFQEDNEAVYKNVLQFIEVDASFRPVFRRVNTSRAIRYPFVNRIVKHPLVIKLGFSIIPQALHVWVQRRLLKLLFSEQQQRTAMEGQLKERLIGQFKPEVEKVSDLLHMDLVRRWGYDQ